MNATKISPSDVILAFRLLQREVFYNKSDLLLRQRVAEFTADLCENLSSGNAQLQTIAEVLNGKSLSDNLVFQKWLDGIRLDFYPKNCSQEEDAKEDANIITNKLTNGANCVNKVSVFANIPVELHIIDVLWTIKYGFYLEKSLLPCCYGNRLSVLPDEGELDISMKTWGNRSLYKKYIYQYQQWWSDGINTARHELYENHADTSLITLDLSNYYHSIRLDFQEIVEEIAAFDASVADSPLTLAIKAIYKKYWTIVNESGYGYLKNDGVTGPLPISLQSSPLIANWYLKEFDKYMQQEFCCQYYGRYVDDMLIVVRGSLKHNIQKLNDVMQVYFANILQKRNGESTWAFDENIHTPKLSDRDNLLLKKHLSNLTIQSDKVFFYDFDKSMPSLVLDKFEEEQKERSSEFRFLSDEEDHSFSSIKFDTAFDYEDATSKARFRQVTNNKYNLSVYLSKLTKRVVERGRTYRPKEVEKVFGYFQGIKLINNFQFWEKILSLFVVAEKPEYFVRFVKRCTEQINKMQECDNSDIPDVGPVKNTLEEHLRLSEAMAISLYPDFANNKGLDSLKNTALTFQRGCMARTWYNIWPMQQFMPAYRTKGVKMKLCDLKKPELLENNSEKQFWIPYHIPYYEFILVKALTACMGAECPNDWTEKAYCKLNNYHDNQIVNIIKKDVPADEFRVFKINDNAINKSNQSGQQKVCRQKQDAITVALVNLEGRESPLQRAIQNKERPEDTERMKRVLDGVEKISDADIFIMPELSLPIRNLYEFCRRAAQKEVAFVAGIELLLKMYLNIYYSIQ